MGRRKAGRRELERLGGRLAHCSTVVRGGRSFTSRVYDTIQQLREPFHKIRLNSEFHAEINWWLRFVDYFNGYAKLLGSHALTVAVYTDASDWGFGTCLTG